MPRQGREPCERCNGRDTEVVRKGSNYRKFECHDCGETFRKYNGDPCPRCESKNTRTITRRVAPHSETYLYCNDCPYDERPGH